MTESKDLEGDSEAPKPRRRPRKSAMRTEPAHVLVCLPETEALLALSGGAIMPSLNVWLSGANMPCWAGGVPAAQLAESRGSVSDSGELFVFTIDVAGMDQSAAATGVVRLPIPLSKVSAVSVRSVAYRDQLLARVSEFSDVVLDGVELRVEPQLFSNQSTAQPIRESMGTTSESLVDRRPEKCAGAVAGVLAAIDGGLLTRARTEVVWNALGAVVGGEDVDVQLGLALGGALSVESVDELSSEILTAVLRRLRSVSAKEGIEPTQFLDAISLEVRSAGTFADLAGLDRFVGAARPLVSMHPGGNRELLQDGGAIVLRGLTAFLRSPSVEKLAAASVRGGRIGNLVATFAMFLAGYFEGVFALPREVKASSKDRLWGLGELAEAIGSDAPLKSGASVSIENGAAFKSLRLFGRVVQRFEVEMPVGYERFAFAANETGLRISASPNGLAIVVEHDGSAVELFAERASPIFLVPPQDLLRLSLSVPSPKTATGKVQIAEATRRAGLLHDHIEDPTNMVISLLLSGEITGSSLKVAVERLLRFRSVHFQGDRAPVRRRGKGESQQKAESETKE